MRALPQNPVGLPVWPQHWIAMPSLVSFLLLTLLCLVQTALAARLPEMQTVGPLKAETAIQSNGDIAPPSGDASALPRADSASHAQGFVHGFLEGALAGFGGHNARAQHLHTDHVEVLALHIHLAHGQSRRF